MSEAATRAAERAARVSYGRILAMLASRTRDIAAAEDALAEAFLAALRSWPVHGTPDHPDAWLLTVARNHLRNGARHRAVADAAVHDLLLSAEDAAPEADALPDERLKLLFVCAHPAIDPAIRTPLMLQVVLGLDAAQVGKAFLVAPTTMGQRLVRAKAKIRDAGLRFEVPSTDDMPDRLTDVMEAVYAAYGAGWDGIDGADEAAPELGEEALFLGRLLVGLLPDEPEPKGLLALMLYCESRRAARRDADGRFVPLAAQDPGRWNAEMVVEAEGLLIAAAHTARFGRFQCEAAIQSVHAHAAITGRVEHAALATLYGLLAARCPSIGASVGWAAAQCEAGQLDAARATLDALPERDVAGYQPYWVTRARVLRALGDPDAADHALRTAIGLTTDRAVREFLLGRT